MKRDALEQALDATVMLAQKLRGRLPELVAREREWRRGGHTSSSIPEAIRSTPDGFSLASDKVDLRLDEDVKQLERTVLGKWSRKEGRYQGGLVELLLEADRILNYWLIKAPQLVDDPVFPCSNLNCPEVHHRQRAQCDRCRKHRSRHGLDWPAIAQEDVA